MIGNHASGDWVREAIHTLLTGAEASKQQSIFIFNSHGALMFAPNGLMQPYTNLGQTLPDVLNGSTPTTQRAQKKPTPGWTPRVGFHWL